MKISVVVPLYNKARQIFRALRSVLNQSHQEFEIIVVNDGSSDGSEEIVKNINDSRIRLINQDNSGVSSARNTGIKLAESDFIALLDADDEWLVEHLSNICKVIESYPNAALYATSYFYTDPNGCISIPKFRMKIPKNWSGILNSDSYLENSLGAPIFNSSSVCLNRPYLQKIGLFNEEITSGEDLDLWLRISLACPIAYTNNQTAIYYKDLTIHRSAPDIIRSNNVGLSLLSGILHDYKKVNVKRKNIFEYYCKRVISIGRESLYQGDTRFALICLRKSFFTMHNRLDWLKLAYSFLQNYLSHQAINRGV